MNTSKVTLADMLAAREARTSAQQELGGRYALPLLCFTMNMAGDVKDSPLIRECFFEGVRRLRALPYAAQYESIELAHTGPTAYFVFDCPAEALKRAAVAIEDGSSAFRLFDMDVLDAEGNKLSRETPRSCVICNEPAAVCARSRAHGLDAVVDAQTALLCDFAAQRYADMAVRALGTELHATPKPGLVDGANNGAHADMDTVLFERSIAALEDYFYDAVALGISQGETAMQQLKVRGIRAEADMLDATGGVNTHRGAIYALGLLLCGQGIYINSGRGSARENASALVSTDWERELQSAGSHGAAAYRVHGASGARGEAAAGFPAAAAASRIAEAYATRHDLLTAAALTLPHIMAHMQDTNLLHRGGMDGLRFAQTESMRILNMDEQLRLDALRSLDAEFIRRNLSPGGCADALSAGLLLWFMRS